MEAWLAMVISAAIAFQDPEPGISRALAEQRARCITGVRYELAFELTKGSSEVRGHGSVTFALAHDAPPAAPVVLDFAGASLGEVRVNDVAPQLALRQVNGHVVLPAAQLRPGRNTFAAQFTSKVAPTGTPLTVYRDQTTGEEYLYTLVVPADAHRLFPCFDQPDLKATFHLRLTVPRDWIAVANGPHAPPQALEDGRVGYEFAPTKPLSTYLMAFAAGPFAVVTEPRADQDGATPRTPMRLLARQSKLAHLERDVLFALHRRALAWLEQYFDFLYPFGKLDVVLVPGFPYGGMEHAGAIFYRETALAFDHEPTEGERTRRSTLVYHEVAHQWFGNLVSFVWFDDLWLKEGFATFVGFKLLEALEPERNAWLRFHQGVKPLAYRVDATAGTTPIWQELGNLEDAKSAYGAIVYDKAPAVLRELEARLGEPRFRDGLRVFVKRHALGNAQWRDLLAALGDATRTPADAGRAERELARWSERWILAAGMPRVRARWRAAHGKVVAFDVVQQSVQGGNATWPLAFEVLVRGKTERRLTVVTDRPEVSLEELIGTPAPDCVLLNPSDVAYAQFLLDPRSVEFLLAHVAAERDLLLRAVATSALFETVREGDVDPARWADCAIDLLARERDPETHAWLLGTLATTLRRYLHAERARPRVERVARTLLGALREGLPGRELQTFRFLVRLSPDPQVLALCERLLDGDAAVPGLKLGTEDRYLALAALLAAGRAEERAAAMAPSQKTGDVARYVYQAFAARADLETKARYFAGYLNQNEPPEQWMQESLAFFHWPGQEELTLPYLRKALDQIEWVKRNRRIFFMPAWVDAFVNAHSSAKALAVVERFLEAHAGMSLDVRRKVLQSLDNLRRAVKIKERWK